MWVPISAGVADAEIVLGVLIQIFRGDGIAADRGFPRERGISLKNSSALGLSIPNVVPRCTERLLTVSI